MKTNIFTFFAPATVVIVLLLYSCHLASKDSGAIPDSLKQNQIGLTDSTKKASLINSVSTVKVPTDPKKDTLKFLTNSYELNLFEIQLSRMAETNALDPDVKNLALAVVATQAALNEKISGITSGENFTLSFLLTTGHQKELQFLSKITGSDFDKRYINTIIGDHEKSIINYKAACKNLPEGDTKTLAGEALLKIEDQLDTAQKLKDR